MGTTGRLGILVGGGPAPGINAVMAAATVRAEHEGVEVVGIRDGFRWLIAGSTSHAEPLTADGVGTIYYRGGAVIGTSRANPTTAPAGLATAVATLGELRVDKLITIGGDDTAFSALSVAREARDVGVPLAVVHVPKTIDNDLDLPAEVDTFGFQTARQLGTVLVRNIITDTESMARWFFLVAMGRKAGHLALGTGAAAGATITLIAEEWVDGPIALADVVDTLAGAIIKRRALGRDDGVAVIAEGIVERLDPGDLAVLEGVEHDEHGHIRIAEIDIGAMLKRRVRAALAELGLTVAIGSKEVGYELRCADPIASDLIYCRELGLAAAEHVLGGGSDVMVSIQRGRVVPIPFGELIDPATGRARVRLLDIDSMHYAAARRFMIRLNRDDFTDPTRLARLAETAGMHPQAFRERFERVVEHEKRPLGSPGGL